MAEIGQLSYSIILDDKKFNKQAQGIVKKLKDVDAQINELMSSDSTRLSKPFDLAGMSIEKMVTQAKVLEVAFKGLSQSGTGVLSQDAINLKLRWQEIQAEVSKYGLNLKSSLMEQQKIVEPLKNLQQVLAMPTNSLDEVAAKLSEVKRIRAEQIQTDASYISNMSVLNKVEGELISQQKSAIFIGKEALTVEQQLTSELQKRPISINDIITSAKNLEVLYKSLDDKESALGVEAQQRWLGMRDQLQSYGYTIKSSVMEQQTLNGALAMQENTVGQIELKMRALASVRKGINITEKESIETLKKVNDEYMRLGDQLKKVGARQYNLADLARNTNGAFSPLGFSIQQVARELPSLTMGAQMFFLAISNNLPILSDELRKAKESYKALIAEGKAATPVWKQVVSSIFSWQTAMVVGITLLVTYGREIGNWIKGLFGASKANEELAKSMDEINKSYSTAILEGSKNAQKELTNLNLLYKASQNDRKSKEERKKAVDELQKQFPTYFKNLSDEQILAGKGADAYFRLSKSIIESARARAAADKIAGNQSKILDLEAKNTEALAKRAEAEIKLKKAETDLANKDPNLVNYNDVNATKAQNDAIKEQNQAIQDNVDQINALNKANERLSKNININDLTFDTKEPKSTSIPRTPVIYSKQDKFTQDQIREAEDTATKIEQARIDAMDDSFEKRMAQMKLNHEVEIREIRRNREDLLREIIDNERKLFEADSKNKGRKYQGFIMPDIENQMKSFNGNVDLLSRKMIDASELVKKGWKDAGEGIATVFSSQFGISDSSGKEHEILVTPILPDGSVLSPAELEDYIDNILNDSEDILKADNKGLVISIDVDKDGKTGEKLHQLQELYYGLVKSENEVRLSSSQEKGYTDIVTERINVQIAERMRGIREMKKFAEEERLTFASELDQQIYSIKEHYEERRRMAKGNSKVIEQINKNENKEIESARLQAQERQLQADADYNQKYLEITKNRFSSGLDITIKSLEKQIKDEQKVFNNLEKQVINDPNNTDLSNKYKQAYINLKGLNKELDDAKSQKILQMVGYAKQLSEAFGESAEALSEALDLVGSLAEGFDQGGWIGGAVALAANVIDSAVKKSEAEEQTKRNLLKLQYELNKELREQNYNLIESVDYSRVFADNIEALMWLVEKGFISDKQYSVWTALFAGKEEARNNLDAVRKEYDDFIRSTADKLNVMYDASQKSMGGIPKAAKDILNEWKSGAIDTEKAIRKLSEVQGTGGFKESLDILNSLNGELDKYTDELVELMKQMDEFATGTSFDGFLSDAINALDNMRKGVSDLSDFTEESLTNAILSSFKYQVLSEAIKPLYDELAKKFINDFDNLDKDWGNKWQSDLEAKLKEMGVKFDGLFDNLGIDGSSKDRTGLSGSLARASQESIDELTGVMYAGLEKLSLTSNGINAINITTTAMSAELKAQTMLLRSIDSYSSNLPYMRTGIESMVNQGVRIKP